jgi:hypothetical protein
MTFCIGITVFLVGLLVAVITNIPVWVFWGLARVWSGLPWSRPSKEVGVPPLITGTFERALAFGLFYLHLKTAYIVLGFWLGAKLAANWQRRSIAGLSVEKDREIRVQTLIAIMGGIQSVAIGAGAGYVARIHPQWWDCFCSHLARA